MPSIFWSTLKGLCVEEGPGEGNGNPLQFSCLENPRDGRAWWDAVYGVAQSRTQLKQLSSCRRSVQANFVCREICLGIQIPTYLHSKNRRGSPNPPHFQIWLELIPVLCLVGLNRVVEAA